VNHVDADNPVSRCDRPNWTRRVQHYGRAHIRNARGLYQVPTLSRASASGSEGWKTRLGRFFAKWTTCSPEPLAISRMTPVFDRASRRDVENEIAIAHCRRRILAVIAHHHLASCSCLKTWPKGQRAGTALSPYPLFLRAGHRPAAGRGLWSTASPDHTRTADRASSTRCAGTRDSPSQMKDQGTKRSRFKEEQIITVLRTRNWNSTAEVSRKHGIGLVTRYLTRAEFAELSP
jgi:hypothetical protein